MARVKQLRGFMWATVMAHASIISCNCGTPRVHESTDQSSSPSWVSSAFDTVSQRLRLLDNLRGPSTSMVPCIPGRKPAVEVDENLRIHALRTEPPRKAHDEDVLAPVLYTVIDTDSPPRWRQVAEVYRPESPVILFDGAQKTGAVLGAMTLKKSATAGALLVFSLDSAMGTKVVSCADRAGSSVRMASDGNGSIVMVSHDDYDPIEDRYAAGLRVIRCGNGSGEVLAPVIPGTLHEKTFPEDYDIHVGPMGELHVVYEGVRSEAEAKGAQLWHLKLDSNGKLMESRPLANGVGLVYHLKLIAAPSGELFVFELYGSRTPANAISDKLNHRILPLGAMARSKGTGLNFVVDPWIQAHAIWFENNEPKHRGPDTMQPERRP